MARKRAIPLVDLSDFTKGDEASKKAFIKKLSKAFHEIGFVGVVNHGIPKALVNKFYAESQAFFMLPTEKKQKYEVPGLAGQRGYTSFGKEHAKQSKVGDLKEFFQIGQEVKGKDPIKKEYPKNVYVRERPQYLATGIKLYQSLKDPVANYSKPLLSILASAKNILILKSKMAIVYCDRSIIHRSLPNPIPRSGQNSTKTST